MNKVTDEKTDYAVDLIEAQAADAGRAAIRIVEDALRILEFGGLTPRQVLDYIEATGR